MSPFQHKMDSSRIWEEWDNRRRYKNSSRTLWEEIQNKIWQSIHQWTLMPIKGILQKATISTVIVRAHQQPEEEEWKTHLKTSRILQVQSISIWQTRLITETTIRLASTTD